MRVSTLPSAGGLDVNELSNKLATIPVLKEEAEGEREGSKEDEEDGVQMLDEVALSDSSSTAAMFGSETGWRKWGGGIWGGGGAKGGLERGREEASILSPIYVCVCVQIVVVMVVVSLILLPLLPALPRGSPMWVSSNPLPLYTPLCIWC